MGTNCVCHPERKKERQREEKGKKMERDGEEEKYVLVYVWAIEWWEERKREWAKDWGGEKRPLIKLNFRQIFLPLSF